MQQCCVGLSFCCACYLRYGCGKTIDTGVLCRNPLFLRKVLPNGRMGMRMGMRMCHSGNLFQRFRSIVSVVFVVADAVECFLGQTEI